MKSVGLECTLTCLRYSGFACSFVRRDDHFQSANCARCRNAHRERTSGLPADLRKSVIVGVGIV